MPSFDPPSPHGPSGARSIAQAEEEEGERLLGQRRLLLGLLGLLGFVGLELGVRFGERVAKFGRTLSSSVRIRPLF